MRALLPAESSRDTAESLCASSALDRPLIYWLILAGCAAGIAALPLVTVDVAATASGVVRSATERSTLRLPVDGYVSRVLARDNDRVRAGQPLIVLTSLDVDVRLARNRVLQAESGARLADLQQLLALAAARAQGEPVPPHAGAGAAFRTDLLRVEWERFAAQWEAGRTQAEQARRTLERQAALASKGLIAASEIDRARYSAEQADRDHGLLVRGTVATWQARLREEATARDELAAEEKRLLEEQSRYTVRAPCHGTLLGFASLTAGGYLPAGQSLGEISPDDALVVETHVAPADMGHIRIGQSVNLQIDAFPYTQWGMIDGTVESVSDDLLTHLQTPAFRVLIRPCADSLRLPNGACGRLRKGFTLTARFHVARRSLLQLLYDNASSWCDPRSHA